MSSKCIKCNKHITHLEDVLQCSLCKIQIHFHCNGISETAFRKMTNNTKKRFTCTTCNTFKSPATSTEPSNLLEDKIEDLIKSVSFMSHQFDEFNKKIESIFNEIKLVKIENEQIKKENTILSKEISEIRQKIDILEQQNLGASIEIIGIPKTENENCISIVKEIGKKMNIVIPVIEARRITAEKSKSNLIIAKLESKEIRSQLIRKSKNEKLNANMLVNNWPTENKIFINEHLTKDKRILFAKTRAAAKDKKYKFTWISNAEILTRKDENSKTMRIRTFSDLEKM
ncbi:unnamed protein product [Macrosiphum euphorbiae]|uniref:Zinc finger PHD-type domain-containing protein n=1 Tax=Macrosiphum euphorbiae TaxID=13131 RepID=A0AAV0XDG1_9HEMI|nr:unnamed protein product [Macrosiphum euphorbiae]